MGSNIRNSQNNSSELIYIGGIGFMFEVNQTIKHNLISPDVLKFFDEVQESGMVTEDCAFPTPKQNTNQRLILFQNNGEDWTVCSDGIFRRCNVVKCNVVFQGHSYPILFHVDRSISLNQSACIILSDQMDS